MRITDKSCTFSCVPLALMMFITASFLRCWHIVLTAHFSPFHNKLVFDLTVLDCCRSFSVQLLLHSILKLSFLHSFLHTFDKMCFLFFFFSWPALEEHPEKENSTAEEGVEDDEEEEKLPNVVALKLSNAHLFMDQGHGKLIQHKKQYQREKLHYLR